MRTHTTRLFLSVAVLGGVLGFACDASAADAPTFSELPVGRLTTPPKKKVAWVSPSDSVPGLFAVWPDSNNQLEPAQRRATITTDARVAASIKKRDASDSDAIPSGCVSDMSRSSFGDELASDWDANLSEQANAFVRSADNPDSGVAAFHSERLVETNGNMVLESVDAWLDPSTRGVKLISKASLPLRLVRSPIFGVKVYAARDERPDGKRFVQFVVVRPSVSTPMRSTSQMWSTRPGGSIEHSNGCGHARVALPADSPLGESATVVATVVLPPLGGSGSAHADAATKAAQLSTATAMAHLAAKRGAGAKGAARPAVSPTADSANTTDEIRTRMVLLQVSVSKTSAEKEPLVSVSSSWGSREQVERRGGPDIDAD